MSGAIGNKPNWCNPCEDYHPRDYRDCKARAANRQPEVTLEQIDRKLDQIIFNLGRLAEQLDRGGEA